VGKKNSPHKVGKKREMGSPTKNPGAIRKGEKKTPPGDLEKYGKGRHSSNQHQREKPLMLHAFQNRVGKEKCTELEKNEVISFS